MSIYDLTVKDAKGNDVSLAEYKGKVLLIVNTATGCGFTPQYDGLQDLYEAYAAQGFEILDFPCNQFGNQAPGTEEEIVSFCTGRFGITFRQFAKIDVNGENASPLFTLLKAESPEETVEGMKDRITMKAIEKLSKTAKEPNDIKWNFTKFLVDREGKVVARFAPTEAPKEIEDKIKGLL
ncbi:MAG: glutathione peroxidase [Oscillospiraceae bacterium]|nr:glutathione peroxidase [Oscillospiraceae bacterium]